MPKKPRYFAIVSHCLLNPGTRVHILGRRYEVADLVCHYLLSKHISIIQLPCPEFTAMGYWRNPQGRQQYDNVFFKKHCEKELTSYVDMIRELKNNDNTPLCYLGIQGSPTCSIYWGKHKTNRYKTESIEPDYKSDDPSSIYGVMTGVLDTMLKSYAIELPFLEVPIKENLYAPAVQQFITDLDSLLGIKPPYHTVLSENTKEPVSSRTL